MIRVEHALWTHFGRPVLILELAVLFKTGSEVIRALCHGGLHLRYPETPHAGVSDLGNFWGAVFWGTASDSCACGVRLDGYLQVVIVLVLL